MHTLFDVVTNSRFGRNGRGEKRPPRTMRCTAVHDAPPPIDAGAPGGSGAGRQLARAGAGGARGRGPREVQQGGRMVVDLTSEAGEDEEEAGGAARGGGAGSMVLAAGAAAADGAGAPAPRTELMVGFEMQEYDVDLLLTTLELGP